MRAKPSIAIASVLIGTLAALSGPADAACKKFGFTVNDYGKDGPTNDAKNLLDKHISEWAVQNKITDFQTGKKTVSCELFLDVILFDEHTCTASATVCWGPDAKKLGAQSASVTTDESGAAAPPAPVSKAAALGKAHQKAAAAAPAPTAEQPPVTAATESAAAGEAAPVDAAPTTPVEQIAAPADAPPVPLTVQTPPPAAYSAPAVQAIAPATAPGATAVVETGTLQGGQGLAPVTQKPVTPAVPEKDRAAAAAAAASAAAAAERAAAAAETAANAAKEAAAAAVAASAASRRSSVTVPPLGQASGAKPAHTE